MSVDDVVQQCVGCGKYDKPEDEREGLPVRHHLMSENCYLTHFWYNDAMREQFNIVYHRARECEDLYD